MPQSLTDKGGGYHIENLGIATSLSPPFPSEGSTDPPKWPRPVSICIHTKIQIKLSVLAPIANTWSFDHSASTDIYVYA
jgi:hypothetical protein